MSLDKIVSRLHSDCAQECSLIEERAKTDAENRIAEAKKEASRLIAASEERAKLEAEHILEKARSAASLEERRSVLAAKVELIDTVLKKAKQRLNSLGTDDYFRLLILLAGKNRQSGDGVMLLSEKDLARLPADFEKQLGGNITVSEAPAKIEDGFILKYGDIEINCTFDALFSAAKDELKAKACEVLFG